MDPAKGATSARELTEILQQEVLASNVTGKHIKCSNISNTSKNQGMVQFRKYQLSFFAGSVLGELIIDPDTLDIQGKDVQF